MATYTDAIQKLYVAYFSRPADPAGLAYWETVVEAAKGDTSAVSAAFAASAEYKATYAGMDSYHVVDTVYMNLFGRHAEPAGLQYWGQLLLTGAITIDKVVTQVAGGAQGSDATAYADKVTAATAFTNALDTSTEILSYSGSVANGLAKTFIAGVTDDASLATATAQAALDATISGIVTQVTPIPPSQTYNLTSNTDIIQGATTNDSFVSGSTVVINPANGAQSVVDTLQGVDQLNGGGGTDTLNVSFGNATTNAKPIMQSIENVNVTFNAAATLDLSGSTGVQNVTVNGSTSAGTVKGVGAAAVAVSNIASAANAPAFDGLTADNLSLSADTVGKSSGYMTINLGAVSASAATAETLTLNNAYINLADTVANTGITSATIAATGKTGVKFTDAAGTLTSLTTSGAGSVDVSGVTLTALKSVTAGDGGLKLTSTGTTLKTLTTGAGADTISANGSVASMAFNTGGGNDKVTFSAAMAATGSVDLGAGDDTLTLGAAPTAGATLTGNAGTDTLALAVADYNTISGFSATNLAKITGFEVLSITGAALANASTVDLSSIAGLTSLKTLGVATGGAATVTNVGANASITVAGATNTNNGALTVTLKDATGTADVVNLIVNTDVADNNNGTADSTAGAMNVTAAGVETVNVNSTFTNDGAGDGMDYATNALSLTAAAMTKLTITGDAATTYTTGATPVKLATIDASANTGGVTVDASGLAATGVAMTIKGSATAANTLTGAALADTITGGAKADTITGGLGGDTLTGGAGNDKFVYTAAAQSTIASGNADTITDFHANTYGNGTSGAAGTGASGTTSKWTGDVLQITHATTANNGVTVGVYTNAADATTFLSTQSATEGAAGNQTIHAALNSTTGDLYVDIDGNGTADLYIHLTGVTTLNAAAFVIV
ncbi:MAG: DUF4214 domain-containing protein [Telluria sp.]